MKQIAFILGLGLLAVTAIVAGRAWRVTTRQVSVAPAAPPAIDRAAAAARLATAIRYQTVSHQDPAAFDAAAFEGLRALLEEQFPRVRDALSREVINGHSLLYTWPGRGDGEPIVLLAHMDVVPIEAGTEAAWTHPPFAGVIDNGFIWGRGALDDKHSVLAILEAIEYLLGTGFRPARTVYVAFGHDEEVNGQAGAHAIAAVLRARRVEAELVLDEGGSILEGMVPGITAPVASICIGEKGYVSVAVVAHSPGGHSSMPPLHTAIGRVSAAIEKLERHQMPAHVGAIMDKSFTFIGPELPFAQRAVFANLWLFGPLVERRLARSPQSNAAIRTTTAATLIDGGVKENILPASARAVVNFRIMPGDSVDSVVRHVRETVGDPELEIGVLGEPNEPSPLSDPDSAAFQWVASAVRAVFPGTVVTPFITLGATDARHYAAISPNVLRFAPMRMRGDDLARVHGTNERIAIDDYVGMIRFYVQLLRANA